MSIHYLIEQFSTWLLSFPPNVIFMIIISILFIGSILESIPMVGMFFPMETITVFFGILAFKGVIGIKALIIVAFLGLVIGDMAGYYIGQRFGEAFLKKHASKLRVDENKYETIKISINDNLIKVLLLARSNGFTRWLIPFVAGANHNDYRRFIMANIITAAFWSPVFLLGGYYLGSLFETYGKYFGLGIIIATVITFVLYKLYKHFEKIEQLKRADFWLFIINISGIYIFSKMVEDIIDLEVITKLDTLVHSHIIHIKTPFLTKMMLLINSLGNPAWLSIFIILIVSYLAYKKYIGDILFLFFSLLGTYALVYFVKELIARPIPKLQMIEVLGYSFPSTYSAMSTAIAFVLFVIFNDKIKNKAILFFVSLVLPVAVFFDRIYLNASYVSDVVAGMGLALFWVSLVAFIYHIIKKHIAFRI